MNTSPSRRKGGTVTTVVGMASRTPFGVTRNLVSQMRVIDLLNSLSMRALPPELEELYKDVQRVTTGTRVTALEDYLADNLLNTDPCGGVIPTITIALNGGFELKESEDSLDELRFSPMNAFGVDGLGRLVTFMEVVGGFPSKNMIRGRTKYNEDRARKRERMRELVMNLEVSVMFLFGHERELTVDDLGQSFSDINFRQAKVTPRHAIRLDRRDPIITWSRNMATLPGIKSNGGMSEAKSMVTVNSDFVTTLSTMTRFCQGCLGGTYLQEKVGARHLGDGTEITRALVKNEESLSRVFLQTWIDAQGSRYIENKKGYQMNSSLVQALGLVFYSVNKAHSDKSLSEREKHLRVAAQTLGRLNYDRFADHWKHCAGMTLKTKGYADNTSGGRSFRHALGIYLCELVGYSLAPSGQQGAS